ncbi:MAG: hypothetical protein AAFN93_27485 [Bacteroidota bacterium]
MSLFRAAADLVGDVGFGVIKNTSRIAIGGGQAILGVVTEDEDLIASGLGKVGKGVICLGGSALLGSGDDDDDDSDLFDLMDDE